MRINRAIPRPNRDFCPTRYGRFYRPETQGRNLGEPVPMAVSRQGHGGVITTQKVVFSARGMALALLRGASRALCF